MLRVRVVDATPPDSAKLFLRLIAGDWYHGYRLRPAGRYEYAATVPAAELREGPHEFVIALYRSGAATTFPGGLRHQPGDWNYHGRDSWKLDVVNARTPLRLFDAGTDLGRLAFTRIGDAGRSGLFRVGLSDVTGRPIIHFPLPVDLKGWSPADYTASLVVADRIRARREAITEATGIRLRLRGLGPRQSLHLTLMEDDGTSWSAAIVVDSSWSERTLPLSAFTVGRGVLLPQGFPGEWRYWVGPGAARGGTTDTPRLDHLERLQLSLRREDGVVVAPGAYGVEVEWVTLEFGGGTE